MKWFQLVRINWDGERSEYAENLENWILFLKIGYTGSFKIGSYYIQRTMALGLTQSQVE
jgi:hypothetical protein